MEAIILAAGYGTRLHTLTKNIPKPLLEVSGKPIINYILQKIDEVSEIKKIFVVTNDKFFGRFVDWKNGLNNKKIIIVNDGSTSELDRKGAIGDIDFAIKKEKINDDLIIVAGDNLFDFSLRHLHDFFLQKKSSVVALYDIVNKEIASKKLGVVRLDDSCRIIDFEEKPEFPKTSLISTACHILSKKDVLLLEKCIKENHNPDNLGDFIKWLSLREHVFGYVFSERWFDIGTIEQFEKANKEFNINK